jgi:hypothetical protein
MKRTPSTSSANSPEIVENAFHTGVQARVCAPAFPLILKISAV